MKTKNKKRMIAFFASAVMLVTSFAVVPSYSAAAAKKQSKNPIDKKEYVQAFSSDITLNGSGDGYHAKIVLWNIFSLGVQYDNGAAVPYTGKHAVLVENIEEPWSTGPTTVNEYVHPGFTMAPGEKHNYAFGLTRDGRIDCFFDRKKFASYQNKHAVDERATYYWPHVEAIAKHEGDTVDAKFENVVIKFGNYLSSDKKTPVRYLFTDDPHNYLSRVPVKERTHYCFFNDTSGYPHSDRNGYTEINRKTAGPNGMNDVEQPDENAYANSDKITLLSKRNKNGIVENVRIKKTQHFDEYGKVNYELDWDLRPFIGVYYEYWCDMHKTGTGINVARALHSSWDGWDGYVSHAPIWKEKGWDWKEVYPTWKGK